ncbi:hypothetical protein Bhyg_09104 [Pseudolycoriella hygida]|uniref:SAP domain-containing protein n=1 Tax=Pseudolycoriella hygida TaxID=35572 RepID=A0A9Q0N5W7_9DIPT|nr:hypothetical protein Bhyg_09104 [Pseudolycoriella hygida]
MDKYEDLTISQLKESCRSRGLSMSYRLKEDLIYRLRAQDEILLKSESRRSFSESENGGDNEFTDRKSENGGDNEFSPRQSETSEHGDRSIGEQYTSEASETDTDNQGEDMAPGISFNDVKDALEKFEGDSKEETQRWIDEFDDIAETCTWNDVQKYIFARRLMLGEAKACIEARSGVKTYAELKNTLLDRKKNSSETPLEYMYIMQKLGRNKTLRKNDKVS